jgi:hypothetical protein
MHGRSTLRVRVTAVCLLLLAVSPLTAPFSTFDLAAPASHKGSGDSGAFKIKPTTDSPSALVSPLVIDEPLTGSVSRAVGSFDLPAGSIVESTVLRI